MFLDNMTMAAQQVIILYLIVAVGFVADRLHVFTQKTAKASNDLLFYIITPVVIVQSFMNMDFDIKTAKSLLIAFLCIVTMLMPYATNVFGVLTQEDTDASLTWNGKVFFSAVDAVTGATSGITATFSA